MTQRETVIRKGSQPEKIRRLTLLAVFVAIILLMAFTPVGYLKTPGLEITFILIPVIVGAILLGPAAGAILGTFFGVTSFIQCFGFSAFGAALLAINPFFALIVCLVPRVLVGWLTGLIFSGLQKIDKTKFLSFAAASLCGSLLNTILFMGTLVLLYWQTEYIQTICTELGATNVFWFVIAFVGFNGLIEAIVSVVVGTAVAKGLSVVTKRLGV